jgi:hypothetical protein
VEEDELLDRRRVANVAERAVAMRLKATIYILCCDKAKIVFIKINKNSKENQQ